MVNASHLIDRGHQQTLLHTRQFNSIRFDRKEKTDRCFQSFIHHDFGLARPDLFALDHSNNKVDSDEDTIDVDGHHRTVSNATSFLLITIEKRRVASRSIGSKGEICLIGY